MADNENNNNPNGANPPKDKWRAEVEELAAKLKNEPQAVKEDRQTLREFKVLNQLAQAYEEENLPPPNTKYVPKKDEIDARTPKLIRRIKASTKSRIQSHNLHAENVVAQEFTPATVNSQIREQRHSVDVQVGSASYNETKWADLQEEKKQRLQAIDVLGAEAKKEAAKVFSSRTISDENQKGSPKRLTQIEGTLKKRDEHVTALASIAAQEEFRKSQGQDPRSREHSLHEFMGMARQQQAQTQIAQDRSIRFKDPNNGEERSVKVGDEAAAEFKRQLESLTAVMEKLKTATKEEAEELVKKKDAHVESMSDLKSGMEANAQVEAAGGGGGIFTKSRLLKAAAVAQIVGIVGDTAQVAAVDHPIQEKQVTARIAGLQNQKYAMYKAARHGDIASQMAMSEWDSAEKFGKEIKARAWKAEATSTIGWGVAKGLGAAALGGAAALTSPLVGTGIGAVIPGALAAGAYGMGASAVADLGIGASSGIRGIKSGTAQANATEAHMEQVRQINAIPAEQMQGLRDFYVGGGEVAMNMGSRSEGFLSEITKTGADSLLSKMTDANISPEQMIQMSKLGNESMGSMFDTSQVLDARKLEKAGMGSMAQNMQRMSSLAAVGSNNPQSGLESVMASAMTKGLDSSKALDLMVQNTSAMVSQTGAAAFGVDTTGITAAKLAAQVDANNPNKEFAIGAAATAQQVARGAETNTSTTFSGMVNTARISKATGLDGVSAINAGKLGSDFWSSLQGKSEAEQIKTISGQGIAIKEGQKPGELIKTMLDVKQRQVAEGSGAANAVAGGLSDKDFARLKDKSDLSTEERVKFGQIAKAAGYTDVDTYRRAVQSSDPNLTPADKKPLDEKKDDPKSLLKQIDELRTGGFKQLSESASLAAGNLDKIGGALKVFTELNEAQKKGGPEAEKTASTAAADAAKEFNKASDTFGKGVDDFKKAVNVLSGKLGMQVFDEPADDKTSKGGDSRSPQ